MAVSIIFTRSIEPRNYFSPRESGMTETLRTSNRSSYIAMYQKQGNNPFTTACLKIKKSTIAENAFYACTGQGKHSENYKCGVSECALAARKHTPNKMRVNVHASCDSHAGGCHSGTGPGSLFSKYACGS